MSDDKKPNELGELGPEKRYNWQRKELNKVKEDFRRGWKGATSYVPEIKGTGRSIERKSFITSYRLTPLEEQEAMALAGSSVEEKVEFIFELNRHFRFEPLLTCRELARIWGLNISTVRKYGQDAKRQYRYMAKMAEPDPEVFRAELDDAFQVLRDKAVNAKKAFLTKEGEVVYADQPDVKGAIMAQRARAELAGINGGGTPRKREKEVYAELTDAEILEKARAIITTEGEEND